MLFSDKYQILRLEKQTPVPEYEIWLNKLEDLISEDIILDLHSETNMLYNLYGHYAYKKYDKKDTIIFDHLICGDEYKKMNRLYVLFCNDGELFIEAHIDMKKIIAKLRSKINEEYYKTWSDHLTGAILEYIVGDKIPCGSGDDTKISIIDDAQINSLVGLSINHAPDTPNTKREIYIAIFTLESRLIKELYSDGYLHFNWIYYEDLIK